MQQAYRDVLVPYLNRVEIFQGSTNAYIQERKDILKEFYELCKELEIE